MILLKKILLVIIISLSLVSFQAYFIPNILHPILADHIFDNETPTCTITFSPARPVADTTSVTATITARATNSPAVVSLSIDGAAVTLSGSGAIQTYTMTSSSNPHHTFVANVKNGAGNPGTCTVVDGGWDIPDGPTWNNTCSEECGPGIKTRYCSLPSPNGGLGCLMTSGTRTSPTLTNASETVNCQLLVCKAAWIKATGDVHSNTNISAPGGP